MKTLPLPFPSSPASASSRGQHGSPVPISRRQRRILHAGIVALLAAAAPSTRADTNSFTGADTIYDPTGSSAPETSWNDVLNWTLGQPPSPTDDLLFDDTVYGYSIQSQLNGNYTAKTLTFSNSTDGGYFLGADTTTYTLPFNPTARTLTLTGGLISAVGTGPAPGTGIISIGGNDGWSAGTLTINFGAVNTTISNTSSESLVFSVNSVIAGTGGINIFGNVEFDGANTYTGVTTINQSATLTLGGYSIGNPLGKASTAAANLVIDGGTLAGGVTTTRLFTVTPNGATIVGKGSSLFEINNVGAIAYTTPGANETLNFAGPVLFLPKITDNGTGKTSVNIEPAQSSDVILSNSNTYTGITTIYGNAQAMLANGGLASGIGMTSNSASNLIIGGGAILSVNSGNVTDRLFTIDGSGGVGVINTITFSNTGPIAFLQPNVPETLILSFTSLSGIKNPGISTFAPFITDNGTAKTGLTVGAHWQLTNAANNYTGVTTFTGLANMLSLSNAGVPSYLGASTNDPANFVFAGGGIQYTGSTAQSTDRLFTVQDTGYLDSSGTASMTFSNTGSIAFNTVTASSATLVLTGTGTGFFAPLLSTNSTTTLGLTKTGTSNWTLTNPNNNYVGVTTLVGGFLNVPIFANGGLPSSIGAASSDPANIVFNTGGLQYTGSTPASTDRLFTIQAGATIVDSGTGTLTFSNPGSIVYDPSDPAVISLSLGGTGNGVFAPFLPASSTTSLFLFKGGAGTWTLPTPNNAYVGTTEFFAGVLNVATLADGGMPSSVGAASSDPANFLFNGGTLQYTGSSPISTDHLFTIATKGGAIDVSGSGALTWSNTGAVAFSGTNTSPTFTLTGSGTGVLNPAIANNGTGLTALTKTGTGQWTLGGANTYGGATSIQGGTLVVSGSLTGTAGATVGDGTHAATLSGNGSITPANGGAVTIQNGATLAPSAGNAAGLSISAASAGTAALTFQTGSTLQLSLADHQSGSAPALSDYAKLTIGTGVTVNLGGTIVTNFDGSLANGEMFSIILDGAAVSGRFANTTTAAPQSAGSTFRFTSNGMVWDINYAWNGATTMAGESPTAFEESTGGTDVALLLVSVPEPGEALLLASGCALLLGWCRRRAV